MSKSAAMVIWLDAVDALFCLEQPAEEIKTVLLKNCFADSKVWCLALEHGYEL
jgi:hypothetical protein